jgi:dolichol-phosphate mannosyltransferase
MEDKLISIICPVLNEEEALPVFYERLAKLVIQWQPRYSFEFVFTDNCSSDRTFEILTRLSALDPRVRVYRFSKNFGYQASIFTGYTKCRGAAAIQLDVDLQDPPEMIGEFLQKWEEGYRVVYGVRIKRNESWWMNLVRKIFYRTLNLLSAEPIAVDAGDFRLVDRKVIDQIKKLNQSYLYLRGSIAQMGFKQIGIPYIRQERTQGHSKFGFAQLTALAVDSLLLHSTVPLRFAAFFGLTLSVFTSCGALAFAVLKIMVGSGWPAGFTTVIVFILLSLGINSLFLGILGEYVGRIYRQRHSLPGVIIDEQIEQPLDGVQNQDSDTIIDINQIRKIK